MKDLRSKEAAGGTESLLAEVTIQGLTNHIQATDILYIVQHFLKFDFITSVYKVEYFM